MTILGKLCASNYIAFYVYRTLNTLISRAILTSKYERTILLKVSKSLKQNTKFVLQKNNGFVCICNFALASKSGWNKK